MSQELFFKILVITILLCILLSLSGGLFFLIKDKKKSNKMVTSLSLRVGLSIILFFLLFYGFYSGLIQPHGI
ncbi:MAG: twin transmembrane helix small protein [Betaproteobacteria bacterium]|nr:twin transmembrane helix small protein [Betaproteobacteria bacterium]